MKYLYKTDSEYVAVLKNADQLYYETGESPLTDKEYDKIKDEFLSRFPDHEYSSVIGSPITQANFQTVEHSIKMGSQSKVNTPEELLDWAKNQQEKVDEDISFLTSEKIDGFSLSLKYENGKFKQAITRGDGIKGEDVTENVKKMKEIPLELTKPVSGFFRGEAVIFIEDFVEFFPDKANPRNASAGTIRRLDGQRCEHITFLCYDSLLEDKMFFTESEKLKFIKELGFKTPLYETQKNVAEVVKLWQEYENGKREQSLYEMDGLVVCIDSIQHQQDLGIINQKPRYSRAFKFTAEVGKTNIEKIDWFVGRTGRITPVAVVSPIKLAGVVITNVTLHNLNEIKRLRIKIGSTVALKRAGDVIPKIEQVLDTKGVEVEVPHTCPSCGQKTVEEDIFLWCKNKACPIQNYETLLYWVKSLEIKGFGNELVLRLTENGMVKEPADFYTLTKENLIGIERMGEKSASKVLEALHKQKELPLPVFIKGLGIPMISDKTAELIQTHFPSLDEMKSATEEQLSQIHGVGKIVAKNFLTGLKSNENKIKNLLKHIKIKEYQKPQAGFLTEYSFCFTGIRSKDKENYITQNGGKVVSGVSKNLTLLIAKDPEENSSKLKKAKQLGIKVITLNELDEELEKLKGVL